MSSRPRSSLAPACARCWFQTSRVASWPDVNRPAERADDPVAQVQPAPARDPLRVELARCGAMGEAGGRDPSCLHAWAENRRRFLGQPAPVASQEPTAPTPSIPDQNGSR